MAAASLEATPDEKQPLIAPKPKKKVRGDIECAYSVREGHCTVIEDTLGPSQHVVDYDAEKLATMRVLFAISGSVFTNSLLWVEQVTMIVIFCMSAAFMFSVEMHFKEEGGMLKDKFESAVEDITGFVGMMSGLAAFLLGFYTSLSVSRWWRLRTAGVGSIWSASSQLSLYTSQFVTKDPAILSAIRRYARASLFIVFMRFRGGLKDLTDLSDAGILTGEEVTELEKWNSNLAESIWTWNLNIVAGLHKRGLIKSDFILNILIERCNLGRGGAATIGAQLGTPIPMQYVHILGFLVKIHNLILACFMGGVFGCAMPASRYFVASTTVARVFFVPLLYNSLLIINSELVNPFGDNLLDFSAQKYDRGIEGDGKSYVDAGEHIPTTLAKSIEKADGLQ